MVYQLAGDFYKILRGGCTIFANLLILNLPTKKKNTNFSADKNAGSIDGISIRLPNYQLEVAIKSMGKRNAPYNSRQLYDKSLT